ncbi:MAG TPA: NifB/NifX family molybdenum-iron cluster-binding protein [bacterium]|nr:NifB/NifX family molybdenum-iron cluster-binding protein [bacterium]HQP98009.1 NifB/NifX family molybdenum-iron cluster-binding protein [bacterium]
MKVAITSTGTDLDRPVDERFGRAKVILVVDTESEAFKALDNSVNLNAAQGAGIQTAQRMADEGVQYVLTGHIGPKAYRALNAAGIQILTGAFGTVRETLDRFKKGEMKTTDRPDVQGHWS